MNFVIHYGLHFIVPFAIAYLINSKKIAVIYLIFLAAMLIDLDHLFATPVFDPNRCSISFHPLHSYYAITCYIVLTAFKKTRIWGIALLWHIITDSIDCLL